MSTPSISVKPADRTFRWTSSVETSPEVLESLQEAMSTFYAEQTDRSGYQSMVNEVNAPELSPDSPDYDIAQRISALAPDCILEVGCGDGRLYRHVREHGYSGTYAGVEVADYVIEENRERYPDGQWRAGTVYELPDVSPVPDVLVAQFVLEHLVYPKRGLKEMLAAVQPGGTILMVFPDFSASGRFPSQLLGFSVGRAKQKLREGRYVDAIVSLYDGRIRLPRALNQATDEYGPFPVNTRPLCLTYPEHMEPDVDAIYVATKEEVEAWARRNGCSVTYSFGHEGRYCETAFMEIRKPE